MTRYLLDTDHISLVQRQVAPVVAQLTRVRRVDQVVVSTISVEEQIRGRLDIVRRYHASAMQVAAYAAFDSTVRYFNDWEIIGFTQAAYLTFVELRQQRIRIGSQDLRIAAIARAEGAILVTRNTRDFVQVPDLQLEDWTR